MSTQTPLFGLFSLPASPTQQAFVYLHSVSTRGQESCKVGQKVKELFMQYFTHKSLYIYTHIDRQKWKVQTQVGWKDKFFFPAEYHKLLPFIKHKKKVLETT